MVEQKRLTCIIRAMCVILRSVSDEESIEILRSAQNDRA